MPKKYQVDALIIFEKDKEQYRSGFNSALNNLDLLNNLKQNNRESDIEMLRSYQLIRKTIEKLDFQISYYKEGAFFDQPLYKSVPFQANVTETQGLHRHQVYIEPISADRYKIIIDGDLYTEYIVRYGEEFSKHGLRLTINKNHSYSGKIEQGDRYYFVLHKTDNLVRSYQNRLIVEQPKDKSNIVRLSTTGKLPDKEIKFLNTLIETFKEHQLDRISRNAVLSIQFIDHHLQKIERRLLKYENEIQALRINNEHLGRSSITTGTRGYSMNNQAGVSSSVYESINRLEEEKMALIEKKDDFLFLSQLIKNNRNIDSIVLPMSNEIEAAGIDELLAGLSTIQKEINASNQNIQKDHPFYKSLQKSYKEQKQSLLTKVNIYVDYMDKSISRVDKKIAEIEKQIPAYPLKERRYRETLRRIEQNEKVLDILSEKKIEFELIKASKTPNFEILKESRRQHAEVVSPNVKVNYLTALFLGLVLPAGLLILKKSKDSKVSEKEEIKINTKVPILHALEFNTFKSRLPVYTHPQSSIADGFRYIRTKISYQLRSHDHKVIMVSSMVSGEGKSYVSSNLATIMAMGGIKTVLVSADLRKPSLHNIFTINNKIGLNNYLNNDYNHDQLIQPTEIENLFIVPPGKASSMNVGDLISVNKISALVDYLSLKFEYIIFDSPPFSMIPESILIGEQCHSNIFLIRHNYSPKKLFDSLNDIYQEGRLKNMSLLVNGIKKLKGLGFEYYFGYDSSYGYGYHNNYYNQALHPGNNSKHVKVK